MNQSNPSFSAGIYTLGCKVNQYESEAIAEALAKEGVALLPPNRVCDASIINTCTVTAESDRKARQFIRRAIAKNPEAYITLIIKNGSTTVDESTITCDGTLGNAIELYCAGEGYEEECFNTSGILTAIGELTTADGKRWSAYYEDQGSSKAFSSIKDQPVENGKTVVVVLG